MIMLLDDAFRVNSWTHTFHSILSEAICTAWTRRCMHAYDIDRDTKQGPSSTQPCSVCMNCNYLWSRIECSWHGSDSFFFSPSKRKFICCDCIVFDCAPEQRAKRQENELEEEERRMCAENETKSGCSFVSVGKRVAVADSARSENFECGDRETFPWRMAVCANVRK